jgi:hypothetical protein
MLQQVCGSYRGDSLNDVMNRSKVVVSRIVANTVYRVVCGSSIISYYLMSAH